jgi:hypothetical protein
VYRTDSDEFWYARSWLSKRKGYHMKPGVECYNPFPTNCVDEHSLAAGVSIPVYTCVIPKMLTMSEVASMQRHLRARSGPTVTFDAVHGMDAARKKGYIHFIACKYDSFGAEYAVKMFPADESTWRYESDDDDEVRWPCLVLVLTCIWCMYCLVYLSFLNKFFP